MNSDLLHIAQCEWKAHLVRGVDIQMTERAVEGGKGLYFTFLNT